MKKFVATLRRSMLLQVLVLVQLTPGLVFLPVQLSANPEGGVVVAGNVNFSGLGTPVLDINNASQHAIIDWQSFSIGAGEVTNINQAANAHTLNRVISSTPTEIYGMLKAANGGVTVINSNGIMVGESGVVDIAGLMTMSTLDVSNNDFLNGGSNNFKGDSSAGIRNYGSISSQSGDVVLLGNFLQNAGSVSAPDGTVAFGAGGDMIVDQGGGGVISVRGGGPGGETGIENTGSVNAAGVELKAHGNVYALAIKNDGLVRASGYNFKGGRLTLSGGSNGNIVNNGQLQARNRDGSGGQVEIAGGRVQLAAGSSTDASGELGRNGGSVDVSGSDIVVGQGASVVASGATGGTVSIVGANSAAVNGSVDSTGEHGKGGRIDVTAAAVTVSSTASLNASGLTGGGKVRVGGGFHGVDSDIANSQQTTIEQGALIIADGEQSDGGEVVIWSDGGTLFEGEISAQALGAFGNGGFIEVSGRESLQLGGLVSTASANGQDGTFLIDPVNVVISRVGGGGTMTDDFLRTALASNNVIVHTSGGTGAQSGTISVLSGAKVIYDSVNSLTFLAHSDIFIDGDIKNIGFSDMAAAGLGTGHITLVAGWDGTLPSLGATANAQAGTDANRVSAANFVNADGSNNLSGGYGTWGAAGSRIFLNEAGLEPVEVGSARGETNLFADVIQMRLGLADGRFTQIGYRRVGDVRDTIALGGFGGYFANPNDQIVDGDINVYGRSNVFMRNSDQATALEGNKNRNHIYTMIGHGGMRRNEDAIDAATNTALGSRNGYDTGYIGADDGTNSGDITVFAGAALIMQGGRVNAPSQIGHGGHAAAAPNSGNVRAGITANIIGNMSGEINVKAGLIDMEAGLFSDSPVQIGHGGLNIRGEFSGDISVESTVSGITGTAAPVMGHDNNDNGRDRSYVQIGHGGSGSFHAAALPARNGVLVLDSLLGNITVNSTSAAGDGININPLTGLPYGHSGDISVISARGINMTATGQVSHASIGHGGQSSHGDHRGNIFVQAKAGAVIFDRIVIQVDAVGRDKRNIGDGAFVQIGHGGRRSSGGATGHIDVIATGNIEFYGGRGESFAQIGHGGRGDDSTVTPSGGNSQRGATRANGTHSGNINVQSGGDIRFRSGFGFGTTAYSMIGHGGFLQMADIYGPDSVALTGAPVGGGATSFTYDVDGNITGMVNDRTQQGHNGTIDVVANGDISFVAGQTEIVRGQEPFGMEMNRNDNFTMIGHGGRSSWGDHWGEINVVSNTGDITFEARAGWGGISYEGTNEGAYNMAAAAAASRGAPRIGQENEDNAANGYRNFAMIGNGGYDTHHRMQTTYVRTDDNGTIIGSPILTEVTAIHTGTGDNTFRTYNAHGLSDGNRITFQSLHRGDANVSLATTVYYVRNATSNTFQVSTTPAGAILDVTQPLANNSQSSSGTLGAGIGVWGPSDITVKAFGDVTFKAAQLETVGVGLQTRAIENRRADNSYYYTDVYGNPIALSATVGRHIWSPDIVNRTAPNFTNVGNLSPNGESLGRMNIAVSSYRLSTDATAANQNRFVMANGHGFVGGEIVYMTGAGQTLTGDPVTQAYIVQAVRVNERDFQLSRISPTGVVGALVTIPTAPGAISLNQTWHGWKAPEDVVGANSSFAQIGNGGWGTQYLGGTGVGGVIGLRGAGDGLGHRGDITVEAGGEVSVIASNIDPAVSTRQAVAIQRIAFDGTQLIGAATSAGPFVALADILVGPGAAANATTQGYVGGNFTNAEVRGQTNNSVRLYNYAMIGNGGFQANGDHQGVINITAGFNSGTGGLIIRGGEGREDFAQVGNGGFNSDGFDPLGGRDTDNNRLNDTGSRGAISIEVEGDIKVEGGGRNSKVVSITGTTTDTVATPVANNVPTGGLATTDEDRFSYAQIGNGGGANGGTSSGDITITSNGGRLDVIAGNNSQISYAQVGHGGYNTRGQAHQGEITIKVAGDVNVQGGTPFVDPGTFIIPGTGTPSTAGQIAQGRFNYAQIGHGGWDADPQGGNLNIGVGLGGFVGGITVISRDGSISLRGGGDPSLTRDDDTYFRGLSAHIGHGGNFTDGDHRGDILISAGQNVELKGAAGGRDSFTMIGHGGHQVEGNLSGVIEVIAGNDVLVNRGADTDTSAVGSTNRAGMELHNNWTKIGHGDHRTATGAAPRTDGLGTRQGDIFVSAGNDINLGDTLNRPFSDAAYTRAYRDQVLIGHIDGNLSDVLRSLNGDTFLSVSRDNPFDSGTGEFITNSSAVISSAGEGIAGELRIYMPNAGSNRIAAGTRINDENYTTVPAPGSLARQDDDEHLGTQPFYTIGTFGELEAAFPADGVYPTNSFGLYNVYYAEQAPVPPLPGAPDTSFLDFDSYDRDTGFFGYDGYEEMLFNMALEDAVEDDRNRSTGFMTFEEWLDGSLGNRREGRNGTSGSVIEDEEDEESLRRKRFAKRQVGRGALTYYVFDPGTNRLSSYRVFGVPQTTLGVTQ